MATIVYRYGIRRVGKEESGPDLPAGEYQLPDDAVGQLRLGKDLDNALVEIKHDHENSLAALWSSVPEIAAIEARLTVADEAVTALIAQAKEEHSQDRTTATRPETAAAIETAKVALRQIREERRVAIREAYPAMKPQIEQLRTERKAAIKALYADYVQERGLYWATFNAINDDHRTAVKAVEKQRKSGRPAQLRFRRWDGTGTLTVQLQREHGTDCLCEPCAIKKQTPWHPDRVPKDPPRAPALLASGEGKWRNTLQLSPWIPPDEWNRLPLSERRRRGRGWAIFNIGDKRTIKIPVQVHRMMPADADICVAQLTRVRMAGRWRLSLALTIKIPDPEPVQGRPPVALHVGWRTRADGSIRVGTWASTHPLDVPKHLEDVVISHGGRWGEVVLSGQWRGRPAAWGRPSETRRVRDLAFEPVKNKLVQWLADHPEMYAEDDRLQPGRVQQWRSPAPLAALAKRWRSREDCQDILAVLWPWYRQDTHLWEFEFNERDQLIAWRNDLWRQVGAWIGERAGVLVVDDADLRELRRRDDPADMDPNLPGNVAQAARAKAALVSPGQLRQSAVAAQERRGVAVHETSAKGLTRVHRGSVNNPCGYESPADPRFAASATVTCPRCDRTYDQDYNAVMTMLDRERSGETSARRSRSQ